MGFGKPGSFLAAIIFAVGSVSGIITLIVSALYPFISLGGYGLGITAGILGVLVCTCMIFWMVFTNLNEWDPAWIIFLLVIILSGVFSFIAGILFAIPAVNSGVAAAFNFIHFIVACAVVFFWIRSKGLVPVVSRSHTDSQQEYQEW